MTMQVIQHIELGSAAANIEFTSIPTDGTDLVIYASLRGENNTVYWQNVRVQFNNNTSGYSYRLLYGNEGGTGSDSGSGQSSLSFFYADYALATSNTFSNGQIYIPNYRSSVAKSVSMDSVTEHNGSQAIQALTAGLWTGTDPITSVKLFPNMSGNFAAGSSATLYKVTKGSDGTTTVS